MNKIKNCKMIIFRIITTITIFFFCYHFLNATGPAIKPRPEVFGIEFGINSKINTDFKFQNLNITDFTELDSQLDVGYKLGLSYAINCLTCQELIQYRPEFEINFIKTINNKNIKLQDFKGIRNNDIIEIDNEISNTYSSNFINLNIYEYFWLFYFNLSNRISIPIQFYTGPEIYFPIDANYKQIVTIKDEISNDQIIKHDGLNYDYNGKLITNYQTNDISLDFIHFRWAAGLSANIYIFNKFKRISFVPFPYILATLDFRYSFAFDSYFKNDAVRSDLWGINLGIKLPIFQYKDQYEKAE